MSWYGEAIAGWYRQQSQAAQEMGKGISQGGAGIGQFLGGMKQNAAANDVGSQMMNSGAYAPRAALVGAGTNPWSGQPNTTQPGTPTQGTAPIRFTGGQVGLQDVIEAQKARNEATNAGLETQIRQQQLAGGSPIEQAVKNAQVQEMQARTNYLNQRPTADAKAALADEEKNADTFKRFGEDIDKQFADQMPHASGAFLRALSVDPTGAAHRGTVNTLPDGTEEWKPDPNGPEFMPNPPQATKHPGILGLGASADTYPMTGSEIHVPIDVAQSDYLQRYQRIKSAGGRYVPGTPGNSGQVPTPGGIAQGGQGGGQAGGKIPTISNPADAAKLPHGSVFRDPTGQLRRVP